MLAVKDKQPALHQDILGYFEGLESGEIRDLPEDVWTSAEDGAELASGSAGAPGIREETEDDGPDGSPLP